MSATATGPGPDQLCRVVFCLRRLETLAHDEFDAYWREVHAPLVAARASLLGIRRYVQRRATSPETWHQLAASRSAPPAYDGIAELWIERRALTEPLTRPSARAAHELLEDERRFIDLPASPIFVARDDDIALPRVALSTNGDDLHGQHGLD